MAKRVKGFYRVAAWFFSTVIAAGTFTGCGGAGASTKYGPPVAKYGAPSAIYNQKDEVKKQVTTVDKNKAKISDKTDETHI